MSKIEDIHPSSSDFHEEVVGLLWKSCKDLHVKAVRCIGYISYMTRLQNRDRNSVESSNSFLRANMRLHSDFALLLIAVPVTKIQYFPPFTLFFKHQKEA